MSQLCGGIVPRIPVALRPNPTSPASRLLGRFGSALADSPYSAQVGSTVTHRMIVRRNHTDPLEHRWEQ